MSIRFSKKDELKLKNEIKKFNAKIGRLSKNDLLIDFLPSKIKYKEIKNDFNTRKEFNKIIKDLQRANNKNLTTIITNKKGVQASKYELEGIRNRVKSINYYRKKERMKKGVLSNKNLKDLALQNKTFNFDNMTQKDFENYKKVLNNQNKENYYNEQAELYKTNYLNSLKYYEGFELYNKIKNKVESLSAETIVKALNEYPELEIAFLYDEFVDSIQILERISEIWESIKE